MNLLALRDTWMMFQREHQCSLDRKLCRPQLRNEFLLAARQAANCDDEESILWAIVGLRKNKNLPRGLK